MKGLMTMNVASLHSMNSSNNWKRMLPSAIPSYKITKPADWQAILFI